MYLLDTGVKHDHEDIKGRVSYGINVVDDSNDDGNGHGTFVAGICCGTDYGVAKKANIVSVKTLDSNGNGKLSDLLRGLEWITQQHMNGTKNNGKSIVK